MKQLQEWAMPAGRVLIAIMFVLSGFGKIFAYEGTQGYMEMMGVPGVLLAPTILFEIVAGLAIIVGWQTRIAALALAGFTLLTAVIFHADFNDQIQSIIFMKNISITGGLLFLVAHGAGVLSLDNRGKKEG